ncbi:hypothetical protein EJB05_19448, partial [Eragrostis curvula]
MAQVWALSLAVASLAIGMLGVLGVWLCYLFEAVARGGAPPAAPPPQAEEEVEADDVKNGLSEICLPLQKTSYVCTGHTSSRNPLFLPSCYCFTVALLFTVHPPPSIPSVRSLRVIISAVPSESPIHFSSRIPRLLPNPARFPVVFSPQPPRSPARRPARPLPCFAALRIGCRHRRRASDQMDSTLRLLSLSQIRRILMSLSHTRRPDLLLLFLKQGEIAWTGEMVKPPAMHGSMQTEIIYTFVYSSCFLRLLWIIAVASFGSFVYVSSSFESQRRPPVALQPKKQSPIGVLSGEPFGKSGCTAVEDGAARSRIQDVLPGQQCNVATSQCESGEMIIAASVGYLQACVSFAVKTDGVLVGCGDDFHQVSSTHSAWQFVYSNGTYHA